MIVEKIHEFISSKQSKSLEKKLVLIHKNETKLRTILRKTPSKYLLMLLLVNF